MKSILILALIVFFVFTPSGEAQNKPPQFNLDFEKISAGNLLPDDWLDYSSGYKVQVDRDEKKSGSASLLIEPTSVRNDKSAGIINYRFPGAFIGKEIELRGFLKLEDVSNGSAGLFMRLDGEDRALGFDNMQSRKLNGTKDWTEYSIKMPFPEGVRFIVVGAILTGTGKLWVDNLQILIDGKDVSKAKLQPEFDYKALKDKEFDNGSKIDSIKLSKSRIEDLTVLGKVWGFLKYYHPAVRSGAYNWDYELFRILPKILASKHKEERNDILLSWTENLGTFEIAEPEKIDASLVKLRPNLTWINDKTLGAKLTQQLIRVKDAKRTTKSYYGELNKYIGNPQLNTEEAYNSMSYPDAGFRLLSLYRYWNIIQYLFPYKYSIKENWNDRLPEFIPLFLAATDELAYKKAALALIARIHDTHANIYGQDAALDKFRGLNSPPYRAEFVENKAVIVAYWDKNLAEKAGLKIGDVIESVNGKKITQIIKERLPFTPASNYSTQLREIAKYLLLTNENYLKIKYQSDNETKEISLQTYPKEQLKIDFGVIRNKPVPPFNLITPEISYLYPGSLKAGEIQTIIPEIAKTKGLIIDLRTYPSDNIYDSLGGFLTPRKTAFARFAANSSLTPGLFTFKDEITVGRDNQNFYKGKVVVLVNEITQSSAEYTTMAFRAAPNTVVIGSTTAGADGNVSRFFLPGGISTIISGIGVYYPNGRETQRVGIVPDIMIKPTVRGIREGKDELLDKAIEIINSK